jgi:hypothetical protein
MRLDRSHQRSSGAIDHLIYKLESKSTPQAAISNLRRRRHIYYRLDLRQTSIDEDFAASHEA